MISMFSKWAARHRLVDSLRCCSCSLMQKYWLNFLCYTAIDGQRTHTHIFNEMKTHSLWRTHGSTQGTGNVKMKYWLQNVRLNSTIIKMCYFYKLTCHCFFTVALLFISAALKTDGGILFLGLSIQFLWVWYLKNAVKEFLQIKHKVPLDLKGQLCWYSTLSLSIRITNVKPNKHFFSVLCLSGAQLTGWNCSL